MTGGDGLHRLLERRHTVRHACDDKQRHGRHGRLRRVTGRSGSGRRCRRTVPRDRLRGALLRPGTAAAVPLRVRGGRGPRARAGARPEAGHLDERTRRAGSGAALRDDRGGRRQARGLPRRRGRRARRRGRRAEPLRRARGHRDRPAPVAAHVARRAQHGGRRRARRPGRRPRPAGGRRPRGGRGAAADGLRARRPRSRRGRRRGACTSGSTPEKARRTLLRIRRGPRTCPCSGRPGSGWVVGTGWLGKPGRKPAAEADPAEDAVASRDGGPAAGPGRHALDMPVAPPQTHGPHVDPAAGEAGRSIR